MHPKLASPVKIIKKKRKKMAVPPSDRVLRSHDVRSHTPEPPLVKEEDITAREIERWFDLIVTEGGG